MLWPNRVRTCTGPPAAPPLPGTAFWEKFFFFSTFFFIRFFSSFISHFISFPRLPPGISLLPLQFALPVYSPPPLFFHFLSTCSRDFAFSGDSASAGLASSRVHIRPMNTGLFKLRRDILLRMNLENFHERRNVFGTKQTTSLYGRDVRPRSCSK